jgi:hypothetical protein
MRKTLYLHIGTEKTGSTALQTTSAINREALMKHGIFYPRTPGERNHIMLTVFAADGPRALDLRRLTGLFRHDAYEHFKSHFGDELLSEIQASKCHRVYLSNEHLSARLKSAQEVSRLATIVRPLADIVKIVVYLRPQPDLFLSTYSTSIKAGSTKVLEPPKAGQHPRYNYEKMLWRWADVFGKRNVIVRIYDRNTLVGQDVVRDFFSIMNYKPGSDIENPTTLNVRLDHDAMRFLLEFNKYIPPFLEESLNPDRGDIAKALESKLQGPALAVPASILRDMVKSYEKSNARVARRFLFRKDGKLFSDVEYKDNPDGEVLTMERAVEISAYLWRWKQRQLKEARREIARLEAKLASIGKQS